MQSLETTNPQDAHHQPPLDFQAYQQQVAMSALAAAGWQVPGCALPMGFPPQLFAARAPGEVQQPPTPGSAGPMPSGAAGAQERQPLASPATTFPLMATQATNLAANASHAGQPGSEGEASSAGMGEFSTPLPQELIDMRGQVAQLCRTQAGSKYLQRQLLKGHSGVVDVILYEVEQDIASLMCDAYGNYLCSVVFQACSVRQRKRMLERLAPRVAAIACDKRGTHALQALIGLLSTQEEQELLMAAVRSHVIDMCMDPNGTHVVQRLLFCFSASCTDWIYHPVVENLLEVAHHPCGLCVLKKCISQATASGQQQDLLLCQLARHAVDLVQSPYGNYAVQHALEEWGGEICMPIFKALEDLGVALDARLGVPEVLRELHVGF
jgi:hypothetical protein